MAKEVWRGGNMLYPVPAVMVSCGTASGEKDIVTVAWTGTVCTNPPMLYISLRPERHSYHMVRESGEFVVNLVNRRLLRACDWCGVRSGRDFDKWAECGLTPAAASSLKAAPLIAEAPVSLECRVVEVKELGSHHMFLAEVTTVQVEEGLLDERGRLDLARAGLTAYSHGEYFELGERLGTFGCSVRKKPAARKAGDKGGASGSASAARGGAKPVGRAGGGKPAGRGGAKPAARGGARPAGRGPARPGAGASRKPRRSR